VGRKWSELNYYSLLPAIRCLKIDSRNLWGTVWTGKPETLSLKVKREIEEYKEDEEGCSLYTTPFHGCGRNLYIPPRRRSSRPYFLPNFLINYFHRISHAALNRRRISQLVMATPLIRQSPSADALHDRVSTVWLSSYPWNQLYFRFLCRRCCSVLRTVTQQTERLCGG
jgi:hypothetical protein